MSEKFRLDRKIGIQNTFYTKCINVIIDSIGLSIILRSIVSEYDQEIPQSQTADNPVAPRGRVAQPSRDSRRTN